MPIALLVTDLHHGWLGHAVDLGDALAGRSVLRHTVERAARIEGISKIILVHPPGQEPLKLLGEARFARPVVGFASDAQSPACVMARWRTARKWALTAWRGGLGGATAFDELLPAAPLAAAMAEHHAAAAVLLRADWCCFDPALASAQLAQHLKGPDAYKMVFTQAPPGLSGIVTSAKAIEQFAQHHASFGPVIAYDPRRPGIDPIGRDVNIAIEASVRDTARRFVYDTPRSRDMLRTLADRLGEDFVDADAQAITDAQRAIEADAADRKPTRLPQQVTLELTPRRLVTGPAMPHHYARFDRDVIDVALAERLIEQLADETIAGDVVLSLGGLGDALLHPAWRDIATAAREAGVLGVELETDLLCDEATLEQLGATELDVLSVRLNADTAAVYEQAMGRDSFAQVIANVLSLVERRHKAIQGGDADLALAGPHWIVPRLVKTKETLADLETFFDRWVVTTGHAVIEPSQSGCGLMPELSPVPMAPPRRTPCRQLSRRMTILANGQVALCDQDWLGRAVLGDARQETLLAIWQRSVEPSRLHAAGRLESLPLCTACSEWHRP